MRRCYHARIAHPQRRLASADMSDPRRPSPPVFSAAPADAGPPLAPRTASKRTGQKAQFSMRSLMIVTTVAALAAALMSYIGLRRTIEIVWVVWLMMVPTALGTLAVCCRGHRRTLFAGAFAGWLGPMFLGVGIGPSIGFVVLQIVSAVMCALTALGCRRFIESRGWHRLGDDDEPPANR